MQSITLNNESENQVNFYSSVESTRRKSQALIDFTRELKHSRIFNVKGAHYKEVALSRERIIENSAKAILSLIYRRSLKEIA